VTLTPEHAIGVFDSGVGGLTILDECLAQLPAEDFIYFGDTAWFPYGDRTDAELRSRAQQIAVWLIARGVKTIVIACNTATAAALTHLQTHLDVPVIGVMSSEAHAAVQTTRNRRVGLLATEATVRSGPRLAPAIQNGDPFDERIVEMVKEYTAPLREEGVDTVILGCTHYPLVERLLRRNLPNARLIKSGEELARELRETLERKGLLRTEAREGHYRFACSGDPAAFQALGTRFLQMPLGDVERVEIPG
jgi:glutamate racemase